jgi:hypothetical protein
LIDDEENKSDANTNNPATQQLVTSNTKLQKGVRELLSLFDFLMIIIGVHHHHIC